jgi:hypothetical protein
MSTASESAAHLDRRFYRGSRRRSSEECAPCRCSPVVVAAGGRLLCTRWLAVGSARTGRAYGKLRHQPVVRGSGGGASARQSRPLETPGLSRCTPFLAIVASTFRNEPPKWISDAPPLVLAALTLAWSSGHTRHVACGGRAVRHRVRVRTEVWITVTYSNSG